MSEKRLILSGDEAVANAAFACAVRTGVGYPGTPSTEILETLSALGGNAEWAPNEKVALEVGVGTGFGGARALVTMKHVGLNVAADPLFTLTYTGTRGGIVIVSADDPGMASSQNEQDNRNYARFAQMPMLEPSDSQEAYDFAIKAFEISEKFEQPVLLRMTTRVCHSRGIVNLWKEPETFQPAEYARNVKERVMVPANARPSHVRLVNKMNSIAAWNETSGLSRIAGNETAEIGVITSGISFYHTLEAAPQVKILKLGMTWPLPAQVIRDFAAGVKKVFVVEEGSRFLEDNVRLLGVDAARKPEIFEFGELSVSRVAKLLADDSTPEPMAAPGRPPALCPGCPHRKTFELLRDLGCIVSGDIGCYTLGVLPPFNAMDVSLCMGASIGMALGMRRALPEEQARKVVSVIGDSTFMHSGITGIVEMVYNRPATGHLVFILDNSTTAMTGFQEHAATGRNMKLEEAPRVSLETLCKDLGVQNVDVIDPVAENAAYAELVKKRLAANETSVIIVRRPCVLEVKKLAKAAAAKGASK